ncbi:MAG: hypothetical protein ABJE95_23725 [Byssovorax sp.]
MKTKRVFGGGAAALASTIARRSGPAVLAVALLGATALACKSGNGGQENGTPADPGPAVAQGADVVRYSGMEVGDSGQAGIRQAVQARRAADWNSTTVATLYPGTVVTRVARYGNYNLVAWTGSAGAQQGWVDSNVAFATVRYDGGVGIQPPTVFGATPVNQPPGVVVPPQPVVTAPPPVVTAPPPVATAPPVATTPPKPTATVVGPKPTATPPKSGFKPPKLN